jgi:glycine/sarcosine N-methyltransferase
MHNEHYKSEYTTDFVSRWDDLIGWEGRQKAENNFFEHILEENGCKLVADIAAGTGYHAITLAQYGFKVVATDGARTMVNKTKENADRLNVKLEGAETVEWADLDTFYGAEHFDGLLCLGNAFTHLFEHEARIESLKAMFRSLKPGGVLALDHRNYDSILDNGFSTKHKYYYTGDDVDARPVEISDKVCRFEYSYQDGSKYHLNMFPLRQKYIRDLFTEAGFTNIQTFGDFKPSFNSDEADFIHQIAYKPGKLNSNGRG